MGVMAALLRAVPVWAWVLLAILAWGGWQRHLAASAAAALADNVSETSRLRERGTAAALAETTRRISAQSKVASHATNKNATAAADAAGADRAAQRLLDRAEELAARAGACDSAVAGERQAAADAARVLADMLRRADERAGILARMADSRGIAGDACEQSYDALSVNGTDSTGTAVER